MIKKITIASLLGLLLVFGISVAVFAQDEEPPVWEWGKRNPVLYQAAEILGMEAADLKVELAAGKTILEIAKGKGVSLEELVTELTAPMVERMKVAVEDGRVTQAEADERIASMEECLTAYLKGEDFECDAHFRAGNLPMMMHRFARTPMKNLENLAVKLNMTVVDLKAALEEGKTIPEIAESQGITMEDLKAEKEEAMIERINQAVTDGKLTQEEADEIIAWIKARPENAWFNQMGRNMFERHHRPGGRHQ